MAASLKQKRDELSKYHGITDVYSDVAVYAGLQSTDQDAAMLLYQFV